MYAELRAGAGKRYLGTAGGRRKRDRDGARQCAAAGHQAGTAIQGAQGNECGNQRQRDDLVTPPRLAETVAEPSALTVPTVAVNELS